MRLSGSIPFSMSIAGEDSPRKRATLRGAKAEQDAAPAQPSMDETAFRELYSETAPKLCAYLRKASGDAALADDILQETFYRFLRAEISRQRPGRPLESWQFKAYLYRTANNLLTDHWRRMTRERCWSLKHLFGGGDEPTAERRDETGAMRVFRRLKPQEQTLLWLAYVEGFSHREIAAALQVTEKSVRVLLFRARQKLGAALAKEGFGSPTRSTP